MVQRRRSSRIRAVTDPKLKKIVSRESGVVIWRIKPIKDEMMQNPNNKRHSHERRL